MKILFLTSEFPYPPRGGGALRIMGLVTGAAQAGHEVHLLSFGLPVPSDTPLHNLCASVELVPPVTRTIWDRLGTLLLTKRADMEQRSYSSAFLAALKHKLAAHQFDIVQFQSLEMGVYLETVRRWQPSAKLVYDAYNAEAELQRMVYETDRRNLKLLPLAAYSWLQWRRLRAFEGRLCQAADAVIAVSDADQRLLSQAAGQTPVRVVSNGIAVKDYAAAPQTQLALQQPSLLFTGTMDYRPNVDAAVWFAEEIMPLIPQAHLYLVGNRPHPRVQALAERENITVTGFVEDTLPYLHQTTVFIVPLRIGSGTRLKLLQAMSAGCAIVSTSVGAMGLGAQHNVELMLADEPQAFAAAVNGLLKDESQRQRLAENARAFVTAKFDWTMIAPHLLAVYDELRGSRVAKR